ncbi:MAG: TonB-dependent receptor, partial [Robiginitomaculum sp.]|nr:TonB-dependent receptor [Robiginitomaculum sp.]
MGIERVEILKGPQGTLFGRDTIGGAINITTKAPTAELEGRLQVEAGNYGRTQISAQVNIPLKKDVLALRLSAQKLDKEGYILNAFNGNKAGALDHFNFNGQLYFTPFTQIDARLVYNFQTLDDRPNSMGETVTSIGSDLIPYTINVDQDEIRTQDQHRLSLNVNYQLENGFTLTSISGVSGVEDFYIQDGDRLPIPITIAQFDSTYNETSQELRVTSPKTEKFDYLIGLYYLNATRDYSPTFPLMSTAFLEQVFFIPPANHPPDELDGQRVISNSKTYAVFAHGNVRFTDKWSGFTGIRYTHDTKTVDYSIFGETFALFTLTALNNTAKVVNDPLSWTIGTRYEISDNINTYASISRGYRSATVKDDFISQADIDAGTGFFTEPEFLTNYELGIKSFLMDGKVRANVSAFYMDYTDIQVSVSRPPFLFLKTLTNAAKAHIYGFEAEMEAQITDELRVSTAVGYVKTQYDEFSPSPGVDLAGTGFGTAPDWTISAALDYTKPLRSGGEIILHTDYTDRSVPDDFAPETRTLTFVGDYAVTNVSAAYRARGGKWKAGLWVKNLFDVNEPAVNFLWGAGLGPLIENETIQYEPPRTYGLTLDYVFGGH